MKKIVSSQKLEAIENGLFKLTEVIEYVVNKDELQVLYNRTIQEKQNYSDQAETANAELKAREDRLSIMTEHIK
jgi:hypothetical protein